MEVTRMIQNNLFIYLARLVIYYVLFSLQTFIN